MGIHSEVLGPLLGRLMQAGSEWVPRQRGALAVGLCRESPWGRLGGACRAGREQLRGGETSAGVFLTEWVFGFGGFAVSRVCSYLEEERGEKAL